MMRAKMKVTNVDHSEEGLSMILKFSAVCPDSFGPNGENEDNTFARYTPTAELYMQVNNPDLFGKFETGQKFYVDFTPAE